MRRVLFILSIIVFIFAACKNSHDTPSEINSEEKIVSETKVNATPTPAVTLELVEGETLAPTPTLTPELNTSQENVPTQMPTPVPVSTDKILDLEEYNFWDYFLIPLDTVEYYEGDLISHIDNSYNYSIKYPREWLEKVEYRRHNHSFYAYQSMVFDFDGYSKYENEISITSTMFPYDFVIFDRVADEYIQTYEGRIIGIYYSKNTSDKMEFNFNLIDNKNIHGNITISKSFYNENKAKIFNMLKTLMIYEPYDEAEYVEHTSENLNIKFRAPLYWTEGIRSFNQDDDHISLWVELGYINETNPNFFTATVGGENRIYASDFNDLTAYTNDGHEILFRINEDNNYKLAYEFIIEALNVRGRLDLERDIYENHKSEILKLIKSFEFLSKPELTLVSVDEIQPDDKTQYISKSKKMALEYPSTWESYAYKTGEEYFEVAFGSETAGIFNNYIIIHKEEYDEFEAIGNLSKEELSEREKLLTKSGLPLYLEITEEEYRGVATVMIDININNSQYYTGEIRMEKELYLMYQELIMEMLESIDIIE